MPPYRTARHSPLKQVSPTTQSPVRKPLKQASAKIILAKLRAGTERVGAPTHSSCNEAEGLPSGPTSSPLTHWGTDGSSHVPGAAPLRLPARRRTWPWRSSHARQRVAGTIPPRRHLREQPQDELIHWMKKNRRPPRYASGAAERSRNGPFSAAKMLPFISVIHTAGSSGVGQCLGKLLISKTAADAVAAVLLTGGRLQGSCTVWS